MQRFMVFTFISLMFLLPAISFADMHPPSPCERCRHCIDCKTGAVDLEGKCSICSSCRDLEGMIQRECTFRKCEDYCAEVCYDCESETFKTEPGCEDCNSLCNAQWKHLGDFTCHHDSSIKCKQCVEKCGDCKTNKYKDTPECKDCRTSICKHPNIKRLCKLSECEHLCTNNCFDCKTNTFKDVPECKECLSSCTIDYNFSYNLARFCDVGINIDWCAYHCFDCHTNSRTSSSLYCTACNYTIEELKNKCNKIDETPQVENPQPQVNAEQPQANTEQPQANTEQPQANTEQPKEETDYSMRKPKFLCSATPYIPSSTPIAWLIMLLISLGLLFIHLRRLEK